MHGPPCGAGISVLRMCRVHAAKNGTGPAMKPFYSIIVPCCDVEPYVRECLGSVQKQPFADWELLAVVETSKDGTERAVREIAAGDPRITVFAQPRSGSPAAPRNTALDHARGE